MQNKMQDNSLNYLVKTLFNLIIAPTFDFFIAVKNCPYAKNHVEIQIAPRACHPE